MDLLRLIKSWWFEVFYPSKLTNSDQCLVNFDLESSLAIMGITTTRNYSASLLQYKIFDFILHTIQWLKYISLYLNTDPDYRITVSDFTIPFGQYRVWALNLYFLAYTGISGVWYRFVLFPANDRYNLWLSWYTEQVAVSESSKLDWIDLKRRVNNVWMLLHYALVYGTAVPHFLLLLTPPFYASGGLQAIVSVFFSLISIQRLTFLCVAIEKFLFLFLTFVMILDYKMKTWRSLNQEKLTTDARLINYLKLFMLINNVYQSGNRVLSRIGGLHYSALFFVAIINIYIVFFLTVPFGVKIMTIVSLMVSLSMGMVIPPIVCGPVNQSNKLTQKVLLEATWTDIASISTRLKAQSMMEFNKRYPIGITFFDITSFDTKLLINTLLEMSSLMFLLVIQVQRTRREQRMS